MEEKLLFIDNCIILLDAIGDSHSHRPDIGDNIKTSTLASYADDSKVHKIIKTLQDGLNLQLDVSTLYEWTKTNLMEFNSTKFEILKIGDNHDLSM